MPNFTNAVVLLDARWHGDLGILYPIYFCPVGTVLAFSLNIVPAVNFRMQTIIVARPDW